MSQRHHADASNASVASRGSHEEKRAAEQSLLNALSHTYGVDTQQRNLRMSMHNAMPEGGSGGVTLTERNAMVEQSKRLGKVLVGQEILAQLMLAHMDLTAGPLSAVADTLRSEMKTFGVDESYYVSTLSAIPFQLPASSVAHSTAAAASTPPPSLPSPLATLMCPNTVARYVVQTLLAHTREKIVRHCPCIPQDHATLSAIEAASYMPMWSESPHESLLLRRSDASASRRAIVVATHNQLVEAFASVYFNPVAKRSTASQEAHDAFATAFLRTYRAFMTPHTLLAKLLQRYLVPASLAIVESCDAHGIEYTTPPGMHPVHRTAFGGAVYSQRTCAWLKVNQLIKVRVLTLLARWLRDCPLHFDQEMAQSILLFLEEQCHHPAAYSDCPSMMMQAAEFVKVGAVDVLNRVSRDAGHASNRHPSGRGAQPAGVLASVPPTLRHLTPTPVHARGPGAAAGTRRDVPTSSTLYEGDDDASMAPSALLASLGAFRASIAVMGVLLGDSNRSNTAQADAATPVPKLHRRVLLLERLGGADKALASVKEFHALPVGAIARHIMACSHLLMRGFEVDDVIETSLADATALRASLSSQRHAGALGSGSVDSLRATAVPTGSTFGAFVSHAERLMYWAATLILTAALLDHGKVTDASERLHLLLQTTLFQFIELATALIASNDLHGAFGIVSGLNHPAIARLHRPIFARRFLFYDKLEELVAFFDLSTSSYANYVAHLPDDDVDPPVLLLHQTCEEIRNLHAREPTLFAVPRSSLSPSFESAGSERQGVHYEATDGAPIASSWHAARVVVHWRKFQAISGIVEDIVKYQSVPIAHDLYKEAHATFAECARLNRGGDGRGGHTASLRRGHDANGAANGVAVGVALEQSQWTPETLVTDARLLAQCSMGLWDPTSHGDE